MRALCLTLLTLPLCVLGLAACGDNEQTAGGGDTGTQTASTGTAPAETAGCRRVEEPEPREDGGRKRPKLKLEQGAAYTAVMKTSCGTLQIRLATSRAPKTTASFVALARDDFFDGLLFHRVVPGFVAQGGDPTGTGNGGPGYKVVEAPPSNLRYTRGVVAMAKTELEKPGTSGSQFFVVTGPGGGDLPPDYALLGKVEGGGEVLDRLDQVPNDPADNRPTSPVVIEDVEIRGG